MSLLKRFAKFPREDALKRFPPFISALCILAGVAWLFLLPLDDYSRKTYISENALLPGQVHTYFGGSEHNIFRAYRHEVADLVEVSEQERSDRLGATLRSSGLKVATQDYRFDSAGNSTSGRNVYAVLQGPRADATEAVVLVAAWRNMDGEINHSGVALVLTLARYFKRWSLWSKDIIFLISGDSLAGPTAWVDAYHDKSRVSEESSIQPLALKAGALQGAIAIDYPAGPWGHRFEKLHIMYDGVNGQLPNLDLINTVVHVCGNQVGIKTALQSMWKHKGSYQERLTVMLRSMLKQGAGYGSGPHSSFIPYHVDAITLQTVGEGWHDEMSLGRVIESAFRSLNNLLEHIHQSFFFYLLMDVKRFVSIGTYLPSAMIVAASFTITSLALWAISGIPGAVPTSGQEKEKQPSPNSVQHPAENTDVERHMTLPLVFVAGAHFLGLLPLYIFNYSPEKFMQTSFVIFAILATIAPYFAAYALTSLNRATTSSSPSRTLTQDYVLIQCFSLLLLGMFLSALATLNFSLSLLVGLVASPLSFIRPFAQVVSKPSATSTISKPLSSERIASPSSATPPSLPLPVKILQAVVLHSLSPMTILLAVSAAIHKTPVDLLVQAAFGWHVWGMWTQVVVWLVWWPAWFTGMVVCAGAFMS